MKTTNEVEMFLNTPEGDMRILTKKERETLRKLDIPDYAKNELAEIWASNKKPAVKKVELKNIIQSTVGKVFFFLFVIALFLSYFDSSGTMLQQLFGNFNYQKYLFIPIYKVFIFLYSIFGVVIFLALLGAVITLSLNLTKNEFEKKKLGAAFFSFMKKRNLLVKLYGLLINVIVLSLLILNSHYWIFFFLIGIFVLYNILKRQGRKIFKEVFVIN